VSWTQTAATAAEKARQKPATPLMEHRGINAKVREQFELGGIRTWTLQQLRDAISTDPGYPSLSLVNSAVHSLVGQGVVARVTAKAGGPGHTKSALDGPTQYRRVLHAADEA
jgi:hypothetical protein